MPKPKPDLRFLGDLTKTSVEVTPALVLEKPDEYRWDDSCDVLVVGAGLAGVTAALRTAEDRALQVIAIDRGLGGGASALSGGVIYVGGTHVQKECGIEDSAENMENYLRFEAGDVVRPETLRRFTVATGSFLPWLAKYGPVFAGPATKAKTSYPADGLLYFSGNENCPAAKALAKPAQRGQRAKPSGEDQDAQSGLHLLTPLLASLDRQPNARLLRQTRAVRMITDADGAVIGVEVKQVEPSAAKRHGFLYKLGTNQMFSMLGLLGPVWRLAAGIERKHSRTMAIRARRGVVLSAGGFAFNTPMLKKNAPVYATINPLGTIGDDGSGIKLGMSVGGAVDRMHKISAWRFLYPPSSWTKAVSVGPAGQRLVSEELYGARTGEAVYEGGGGTAWIVYDAKLHAEVKAEINSKALLGFQKMQTNGIMRSYTKKADTLAALAEKIGVSAAGLTATIAKHNDDMRAGVPDAMGKNDYARVAVEQGPFYASNMSTSLKFNPIPAVSMGGLVADEESGAVLDAEGKPVKGLYAAGRTAVGICSNYYVSGLSLADCVWSGLRAAESLKGNGGALALVPDVAVSETRVPSNAV